ncbi:DNA polymerase zeta catalytic subunit [Amphibalanus amphitrite]|uniref:DNA polymerase n=1 Tax=Amphibalanus amphitrite TaxID=1232801 RepID=A0A6A4VQE5_AMPAM|nr:DNA polymerase zeta catalytic subunit [Amphibalanus amphitrite]
MHPWRVAEYYTVRSRGTLQILSRLDIIGRTAELARLFGIQFFDVISRGSQFRVESMMLRLAKPRNMVPVSPSVQQRAAARAPETLPLILEPESKMYTDPVVVLDFQSLYPSMIIAYNYCFSTCLGRVEHLGQRGAFPMGCTALQVPPAELARLLERDQVHVSPSGVAFVTRDCRRGLLPDMLEEILNTRIMVKKAMKANKDRPAVRRVLDFKQLGLKLIANVTYGYTSANFSGRMPCIEVGDSVVSKGRETLERAIRTIESRPEWAARVVYGDTDSLFILLKGRSRSEAFQLGEEMAAAVTAENPDPVKLKFEKVYQPCILQTKKRYVGFMYETADQQEPVYDAKGIETVRRDGCPAVAKILEKSLRLLFTSHDMSVVRRFVTRQFEKFHRDAVSTTDLLFAREYRGRASYQPTACVPALRIADRLLRADRRAEPRVGQRVPYAVVYGAPGLPLIELVRTPAELLAEPSLRLNAEYYVSRAVAPPLQRCLGLLGVDVMTWYAAVPRRLRLPPPQAAAAAATISRFFAGRSCAVCARASAKPVCAECVARPLETVLALQGTVRRRERTVAAVREVCAGCCGLPPGRSPGLRLGRLSGAVESDQRRAERPGGAPPQRGAPDSGRLAAAPEWTGMTSTEGTAGG